VAEDAFRFGRSQSATGDEKNTSQTTSVGENIHPNGGDGEENLSVADE